MPRAGGDGSFAKSLRAIDVTWSALPAKRRKGCLNVPQILHISGARGLFGGAQPSQIEHIDRLSFVLDPFRKRLKVVEGQPAGFGHDVHNKLVGDPDYARLGLSRCGIRFLGKWIVGVLHQFLCCACRKLGKGSDPTPIVRRGIADDDVNISSLTH